MASAPTYESIAYQTVTNTSTASLTFSSIPTTYTDLRFVISSPVSSSLNWIGVTINGSTATNMGYRLLHYGAAGSVLSGAGFSGQNMYFNGDVSPTAATETIIIDFFGYANTTYYKSGLAESYQDGVQISQSVFGWASTATINTFSFLTAGGGFYGNGATFSLYGIKAA